MATLHPEVHAPPCWLPHEAGLEQWWLWDLERGLGGGSIAAPWGQDSLTVHRLRKTSLGDFGGDQPLLKTWLGSRASAETRTPVPKPAVPLTRGARHRLSGSRHPPMLSLLDVNGARYIKKRSAGRPHPWPASRRFGAYHWLTPQPQLCRRQQRHSAALMACRTPPCLLCQAGC